MPDAPPKPPYAQPDITLLGDDHVRLYRETNGEQGYYWNGVPTLILTTKGRKSGEPRTIPIIYTSLGDRLFIIASKGGAPQHPAWYLNILKDPRVQVQVKGDVYEAVARTTQSPEREELWAEAAKYWPNYNVYQTRTDRRIPVVVLDPVRKN
jgi:deazaflavin-dependent oxidoreductase (nitroreductase family)